jgi:hypothetical protein
MMSSLVAEFAITDALVAAFPGVELVQTLADRVDNEQLPALWQAITFVPQSDTARSIGTPACRRELGTARIYVAARTGTGDAAALAHADAVASFFRNWRWVDRSETIHIDMVASGARAPESDGRWLLVSTDVQFVHDYYA